MAQGAFICAARIVQDNHVQPVQQITSNFVPKEEFAQAIIQVDTKQVNIGKMSVFALLMNL